MNKACKTKQITRTYVPNMRQTIEQIMDNTAKRFGYKGSDYPENFCSFDQMAFIGPPQMSIHAPRPSNEVWAGHVSWSKLHSAYLGYFPGGDLNGDEIIWRITKAELIDICSRNTREEFEAAIQAAVAIKIATNERPADD